jgi:hypothetical protein
MPLFFQTPGRCPWGGFEKNNVLLKEPITPKTDQQNNNQDRKSEVRDQTPQPGARSALDDVLS